MTGGSDPIDSPCSYWQEYEQGVTPEAKFVKGTYVAVHALFPLTSHHLSVSDPPPARPPFRSRQTRNGTPGYVLASDGRPSWTFKLTSVPVLYSFPLSVHSACLLIAREYEKAHKRDREDLQCFYDSSLPYLRHPEVRHWGDMLARERASDVERRDGA